MSFLKSLVSSADLKKKEHQFLVDGQEKSQMLINILVQGHDSTPRIKKGTIEIFKLLNTKITDSNDSSMPTIEGLLKVSLKKDASKEKVEEEKEAEEGADVPDYDKAKVAEIMKIFKAPEKKAAGPTGKNFRSFLKQ